MEIRKRYTKRALCFLMAVMLMFSMMLVTGAIDLEDDIAATGATGTVYYQNTGNWSTVYCYMWNGSGGTKNAEWPGIQMTSVEDGVWKYTTSTDYANCIFNNGGNGQQTGDLQFPGDGQIYNNGSWSKYDKHVDTPTSEQPTTNPDPDPTPTTPPGPVTGTMVYLKNSANWGAVKCYMWKDGAGSNAGWPGASMTSIGDNVYQYQVTGDFNMIIFNNGSDSGKTGDMQFPGNGYIYDNSTGEWDIYDTSPIRVTVFGAENADVIYKGMDVTLKTTANSTGGIVSYKFSVKDPSGKTTVISNFSSKNTAVWTPTAVGKYTVTYNYKDAAGNENQRTKDFDVLDDSAVAEPIIKKVSPAPGEIKKGEASNISVTAGGGNEGTKLLFYKYTVKDASGKIVNVPYYTKNASYKFTPAALGTYTVTVSVQSSSNKLAERTFTYESVTNPTLDPDDPIPGGLKGDADGDGEVSVMDATLIQRYLAQQVTIDAIIFENANVDGDTELSVLDATGIQRFIAKIITW